MGGGPSLVGCHLGVLASYVRLAAPTAAKATVALGRALGRPTIFPMPEFAARMALGEMADALLLASARVEPAKLVASRFVFKHRELEPALRYVLSQQF